MYHVLNQFVAAVDGVQNWLERELAQHELTMSKVRSTTHIWYPELSDG